MAGTQHKVVSLKSPVAFPPTGNNTATETKLPREQAAVRVSGCAQVSIW